MKKKFSLLLVMAMLLTSLTACTTTGSKDNAEETTQVDVFTLEMQMNDFRGGYTRTTVIKDRVLEIVDNMKKKNLEIREASPNAFWSNDDYQDFVSTFLSIAIINDTQWFNEEETTWQDIVTQMNSVENSFTTLNADTGAYVPKYQLSIVRNEKDDYSITGITNYEWAKNYRGDLSYRILYDCDKDWCKAVATLDIQGEGIPNVVTDLYEYARIDNNTFAIQTNTERMIVKFSEKDKDMDLRNRTITELYYSRLSMGERTTFKPFEPLPEQHWETEVFLDKNANYNRLMKSYPLINEEGDLATRYGASDSLFKYEEAISEINVDWVFEDKALQQTIVYKDNNLVVNNFNKLSEKYEQFIYYSGKEPKEEVINIVDIKSLVGVVPLAEKNEVTDGLVRPEEPTTEGTTTPPTTEGSTEEQTTYDEDFTGTDNVYEELGEPTTVPDTNANTNLP